MLAISELETGYGKRQVLFGISLQVREGEIVALIGSNGAGKSTVLKAVCGLTEPWKGEIRLDGARTNGLTPAQNVLRGITYAPQGNRVFGRLTVLENLQVGGFHLPKLELGRRIDEVLCLFPVLKHRCQQMAARLSGGERQMLAVARALVPRPKLLMLDEPSLGLSPNLVAAVLEKVSAINRETGVAVLIVEQKVKDVLRIASRVYGMRLGRIAVECTADKLFVGDTLSRLFLG